MQYPSKPWADGQKFINNGTVYEYSAAENCWKFSKLTYNRLSPSMQFIIPRTESRFQIELSESYDFSTLVRTYDSSIEVDRGRMILFSSKNGVYSQMESPTVSSSTVFALSHLILIPEVDLGKRHYGRYRWMSGGAWGLWKPVVGPSGFSESNVVPIASSNVLGGIKVGSGLFITSDGTLEVSGVPGAPSTPGSVAVLVPSVETTDDLFLIVEKSADGTFEDSLLVLDTINIIADREKLFVFTGMGFEAFEDGVPYIFGNSTAIVAAGLPLNSYIRYKWTTADLSASTDWSATYYPSAAKPSNNVNVNILFQYSSDEIDWHYECAVSDISMRWSADNGITWSESTLIPWEGRVACISALPAATASLLGRIYILTADSDNKPAGSHWQCVASGETYVWQQVQTALQTLSGDSVTAYPGQSYKWTVAAASVTLNASGFATGSKAGCFIDITLPTGDAVTGGTGVTIVDALEENKINHMILQELAGDIKLLRWLESEDIPT